jgi:hypothetical protein
VRSRTAGVMTTLMRNGRDRRLGKPVKGHAILERALLVGTRSADHIRASGHCGCIAMEVSPPFENRPYTWLHPNASQIRQIPPCTAGAVHTWPFASLRGDAATCPELRSRRKWLTRDRYDAYDPLRKSPRLAVAGEMDNCVDDGGGRNGEHARDKAEIYPQLRAQ